jgi:hypothetical protein
MRKAVQAACWAKARIRNLENTSVDDLLEKAI